jgi:hypothetical protein
MTSNVQDASQRKSSAGTVRAVYSRHQAQQYEAKETDVLGTVLTVQYAYLR